MNPSLLDALSSLDHSTHPLVAIRLPETTVAAINDAACELLGVTRERLLNRHASSLFHGSDEVHASVALSALASGAIESYCARRRLVTDGGREVWTCVRSFAVAGARVALGIVVPDDSQRPLDVLEEAVADLDGQPWPALSTLPPLDPAPMQVLDQLPARQREIVAALLQGKRTATIAGELFVSESTVRSHLSELFRAFGVRSQTELLRVLRG